MLNSRVLVYRGTGKRPKKRRAAHVHRAKLCFLKKEKFREIYQVVFLSKN